MGLFRNLRKFGAVVALLTGCGSKPQAPAKPGTSIELRYPVVLAGGGSTIAVRDSELNLTTTTGASGLNYTELQIIDSAGGLYAVRKTTSLDRPHSWQDLGTSQYRVHLELRRIRNVDVEQFRQILLEVVRAPGSAWNFSPEAQAKAAARIQGFDTLAGLIAGCGNSWGWSR